jgi:signal peptidase
MQIGAAVRWLLTTEHPAVATGREVVTSAGAVIAVGLLLFGVSGVWPPLVAVESGSMEPVLQRGDLVYVVGPDRGVAAAAEGGTGVVTAAAGRDAGYRRFDGPGDVIVYDPPSRNGAPIIHRAMFWVEAGENWYDRINGSYVAADGCDELQHCPAPHAGFVTKGDANDGYDQTQGLSPPVRPSWVVGTGEVKLPGLGLVRLCFSEGFDRCLR